MLPLKFRPHNFGNRKRHQQPLQLLLKCPTFSDIREVLVQISLHLILFWKCISRKFIFWKCIFRKYIFWKCIFRKCIFQMCIFRKCIFWKCSFRKFIFRKSIFQKFIFQKCISESVFLKVYFPKVYFSKVYFPKVYFRKEYFPKVYFPKVYFLKVCCKYASILGKNFFDPKVTQPKLFQTERSRRLAHLPSFCELVVNACERIFSALFATSHTGANDQQFVFLFLTGKRI